MMYKVHVQNVIMKFLKCTVVDRLGKKRNPYQEAITGVGKVLEFYDDDKMFPTWGFGGRLPKTATRPDHVSHCFALNKDDFNPECAGIEGMLKAYRQALTSLKLVFIKTQVVRCISAISAVNNVASIKGFHLSGRLTLLLYVFSDSLQTVRLAGPTFFSPVINAAIQAASRPAAPPKYYCLLILTDGVIMDMRVSLRAHLDPNFHGVDEKFENDFCNDFGKLKLGISLFCG